MSRQPETGTGSVTVMARVTDGRAPVLRKALTQKERAEDRPSDPAWPPTAQHLLLLGAVDDRERWFAAHPPLAVRIQRIYGRAMPAIPLDRAAAVTWA